SVAVNAPSSAAATTCSSSSSIAMKGAKHANHERARPGRRAIGHTGETRGMEPGTFRGRIGRYHWESEPWWPDEPRPPAGAPNVLVVLLDDVGFAQLGCFGSDIDTPAVDQLAANG